MTIDHAYRVVGVSRGSSRHKAEQAYKNKLQKLQLQMVPGQSLAVRQRAEQQVAELASAWEQLKNTPYRSYSPQPVNSQSPPQQQAAASFVQQQSRGHNWPSSSWAPPLPNRALAISFLIAGFMMLLAILLCVGVSAAQKPAKSAKFRVLSVPWCYVEIDGKRLGTSGQAKPFEIVEGRHTLKLKRNSYLLTQNLKLHKGQRILVKAQLDKRRINVSHE